MDDMGDFQRPRFAPKYLKISERADRVGGRKHRQKLLAGLSGKVIEVGAGHGLNFAHYPDMVTEVVAVEPDTTLRGYAEEAAVAVAMPIVVVRGHADRLPAANGEFDAAVASLVLCTVPDPVRSAAEIARVLRPGGELRFYEHVRSDRPLYARVQDFITPLWSRLGGGCHPNRNIADSIAAAGFEIEQIDRFPFKPMAALPPYAHILGEPASADPHRTRPRRRAATASPAPPSMATTQHS